MNFIRHEVKGEEMVNLARTGFASHQNPRRKEFQNEQLKQSGESSKAFPLVSLQKPDEDTLKCKIDFEILSCGTKINKRLILSTVQKLYDPIGMLTPTALLPKLIIQDLWKSHFSWDEELPPSVVNRFSKWNEYLGQLVQKHNEKQSRNPRIGEIVLIEDDNKKRLFWPLAKVIGLIPGCDGKICAVKLKKQHGTVLRPIKRVYSLEIYSKESVDGELGGEESNSNNVTDNENNITSADAVIVRKFTSSGRPVKAPTRLDLLNNDC
ncbi:DUF5641 domain-containing protein [Nephila pilipes]|uniref:DUF5641 domain-containing protein n=1 Tax=Nephila pilipes TaxID=299642 RepID=A0A8X6QRZ9_NEPPI|nr:DUF5641 domain-containing protein [Nephila pilipes]